MGCLVVEALPGSIIQVFHYYCNFFFQDSPEVGSLWEIVPQKTIGILIGAPLPGGIDHGWGDVVPFIPFPSWLAILPDPTLYLKPALSDFFTIITSNRVEGIASRLRFETAHHLDQPATVWGRTRGMLLFSQVTDRRVGSFRPTYLHLAGPTPHSLPSATGEATTRVVVDSLEKSPEAARHDS